MHEARGEELERLYLRGEREREKKILSEKERREREKRREERNG